MVRAGTHGWPEDALKAETIEVTKGTPGWPVTSPVPAG